VVRLNVAADRLGSFVCCLALGTLTSIRARVLDPEVGIWTLGRPCFWTRLEEDRLVPPEVLRVLKSTDEIDAFGELACSDRANAWLDRMIGELEAFLRSLDGVIDRSWYAWWEKTPSDDETSAESS
jgi:hypothetical protein